MQRPKTRFTKCGDIHIAYQVFGDGPIDLLYAQGWLSNVEYAWESPDYARFLTKLGRFARVIFFDKRGTGMSDRDVGVATLEERMEDINAVLDAVGSKTAVLFGMSEGGAICAQYAYAYPERVSHLIMYGSRPRYAWAPDFPLGQTDDVTEASISELIQNWGEPFSLTTGAPSVADDPAAAEWFAAYLRFSASPRAAAQVTRMNYEIDYRDILSEIRVPTLIIHRRNDQWCPVQHGQYLADHIPGARLRVLDGEDHIVWYGDQDKLIAEAREFVTGESASPTVVRTLFTVLFMDIVGSTNQLADMGDAKWNSILEQLDAVVGRRITGYSGQKVKHTGDGYLLAFSSPSNAIECARELIGDAGRLGLQAKIGIHSGECEQREDDLSGLAVHIAARIMDKAAPQTIFTSQTLKDLVAGSDAAFASMGQFSLKGVPGDWVLYSLEI